MTHTHTHTLKHTRTHSRSRTLLTLTHRTHHKHTHEHITPVYSHSNTPTGTLFQDVWTRFSCSTKVQRSCQYLVFLATSTRTIVLAHFSARRRLRTIWKALQEFSKPILSSSSLISYEWKWILYTARLYMCLWLPLSLPAWNSSSVLLHSNANHWKMGVQECMCHGYSVFKPFIHVRKFRSVAVRLLAVYVSHLIKRLDHLWMPRYFSCFAKCLQISSQHHHQ